MRVLPASEIGLTPMKNITLLVDEDELEHLKWALSMDVEISDKHLKEKLSLLARLKRAQTGNVDVGKTPIDQFNLSVRTVNALMFAVNDPVKTVGELIKKRPVDLLRMNNFGRRSLVEVQERLQDYGLALAIEKEKLP